MAHWYETTPTIWSHNGRTTYINFDGAQLKLKLPKEAEEWIDYAASRGEWIDIVTRAVVDAMLEGVDPKLVTDAKLDIKTTDTKPPKDGTVEEKEEALKVKLESILPIVEYEKLVVLEATKPPKPIDEKPVDEKPVDEKAK